MVCSQSFLRQVSNNSVLPVAVQRPLNGPLLNFYLLLVILYMADIIVTIALYYLDILFDF